MNFEEAAKLYGHLGQKSKVDAICIGCNTIKSINKEKLFENIAKYGHYTCRACCTKQRHKDSPISKKTREKLRKARLGKQCDEATKRLISEKKKEFYQTPEGEKVKKQISRATSSQHSSKKRDKSKRKVFYISAKNNNDIKVCLSSYEFVACEDFFEKDDTILSYDSQVQYDLEDHSRSLDFLLVLKDGNKKVIEIKPESRLTQANHANQIKESKQHAESKGWAFEVWTEKELKINSPKEATRRADEYRKTHYLIDMAAYRKKKNNARGRKHYNNKIKEDKVIIFCEFCSRYHSRLRKTYDINIKKNGRFICNKENGSIIGKREKTHLKNPLEAEGMKKCTGECQEIKPLIEFSSNGSGKISSKCKQCRAKIAKERYHKRKASEDEK